MMKYYILDLPIKIHENDYFSDKKNIERIKYLFGQKDDLTIITNKVSTNSELINNVPFYCKILPKGNSKNVGLLKKLQKSECYYLLSGDKELIKFCLRLSLKNKINTIYIGSLSNSYRYNKSYYFPKYLIALIIEFLIFSRSKKIYAAGGNLPNSIFKIFFGRKVILFNTVYEKFPNQEKPDLSKMYQSKTLLFMGLIDKQKGLLEIIDFIEYYNTKVNEINTLKIHLYGKAKDTTFLTYLESKKCVEYKGYVNISNSKLFYSSYMFSILLSKHEGMARFPLEAMFYYLPPITNMIGTSSYCNSENSIIYKSKFKALENLSALSYRAYEKICESAYNTALNFNGNERPIIR